jgi:methyltransferase family protein
MYRTAQLGRLLSPELLDSLPPDDQQAVRSRRDLQLINSVMFQGAIMRRLFLRHLPSAPRRIIELGGGDGDFMLRLARRMGPSWHDVELILVDRQDVVSNETRRELQRRKWRLVNFAEDVFAFLERGMTADLITANLFLHHFQPGEIRRLFVCASALAPVLIACEPRRNRLALAASRCVGVIGCNRVTRHDAVASVQAGFRDSELSALWPQGTRWQLREHAAAPFSHCFVASRPGTLADAF